MVYAANLSEVERNRPKARPKRNDTRANQGWWMFISKIINYEMSEVDFY